MIHYATDWRNLSLSSTTKYFPTKSKPSDVTTKFSVLNYDFKNRFMNSAYYEMLYGKTEWGNNAQQLRFSHFWKPSHYFTISSKGEGFQFIIKALCTRNLEPQISLTSLSHMTACAYWREHTGGERAAGQRILLNLSRHSCDTETVVAFRFVIMPTGVQSQIKKKLNYY